MVVHLPPPFCYPLGQIKMLVSFFLILLDCLALVGDRQSANPFGPIPVRLFSI